MQKKYVTLSTLVVSFFLGMGAILVAQEQQAVSIDEFIEMVRTGVKKERVTLMGEAMQFTGDEAGDFWPIYSDYEAEFSKLGDERLALVKDFAANYQTMTAEKARELGEKVLSLEEQRTALKKKYFARIADAMSPVVAARFLQAENQINMLLDLQLASQIPLIKK